VGGGFTVVDEKAVVEEPPPVAVVVLTRLVVVLKAVVVVSNLTKINFIKDPTQREVWNIPVAGLTHSAFMPLRLTC
jgi:hypothetical protein